VLLCLVESACYGINQQGPAGSSCPAFLIAVIGNASAANAVFKVIGRASDSLGRPLAGVRLTIQTITGKPVGERVTGQNGRFEFSQLIAGSYSLIADKGGFRRTMISISVPDSSNAASVVVMESEQPLTMAIRAARLKSQNDLSATGVSKYTLNDRDITNLPTGKYTPLNQVLLQMPGVTLDQNQEIHVRGEHMGIQYQMNGVLLPLDINTDPTFTQLLNSFFVKRVSLLDGILPARYGYRTAGVIDIETKQGCEQQGGDFSFLGGQRSTVEPSFEIAGCRGNFGYYVTGLYLHNNLAFSSATPSSRRDSRHVEPRTRLRQFYLSARTCSTVESDGRLYVV